MIDKFIGRFRFLSNFYPSCIEMEGIIYPTVEHAFQAAKTVDPQKREWIAQLPSPGMAKKAGRAVQLREDWEELKIDIMEALLLAKFSHRHLKEQLLATGDAFLVEGNTWGDTFWGVCDGRGENQLGKALMRVRLALR